ncbi:MAG: hypothetical protein AAFR96_08090 [Planctomycetota bacterium]
MMMLCGASASQATRRADVFQDLGLPEVHAAYLDDRLRSARGEERIELAKELAGVYVMLLERQSPSDERQEWASKALRLLRTIPEADTAELRLGLSTSAYRRAEASADRSILLLSSEREAAEAERILREVEPSFVDLARNADVLARRIERDLTGATSRSNEDRLAQDLSDARRLRSIAYYYAGWSSYYLAELTGSAEHAERALSHFGWILGQGEGEPARPDELQKTLLRFEHVARSAIGAAMACSLMDESVTAARWLDLVDRSTDVDQAIRAGIPKHRIRVQARAGAWPDVDTIGRSQLQSGGDALLARLLCVLALSQTDADASRHAQLLKRLGRDSIEHLVLAGEVGHVIDLAERFGTDILGESGFVSVYVRGTMQLRDAQQRLDRFGDDDGVGRRQLLDAAGTLTEAAADGDPRSFVAFRSRALFDAGSALLRAGQPGGAAEIFAQCAATASDTDLQQRASWMRIVCLEEAVDAGRSDLASVRDEAALLFIAAYPASDQAAQLALRPSTARLLTEGQAADLLLSVPRDAPSYRAARQRAAALLYRRYREATDLDRDVASEQFLSVAEELIATIASDLRSADAGDAASLGEVLVLNSRRILDVALGLTPPQLDRAADAIRMIETTTSFAGIDTSAVRDEILFRRLQIASAEGRLTEAIEIASRLDEMGGTYADAAARVMFRDATRAWLASPDDADAAQLVLRFGSAIRPELEGNPDALASVLLTIARAADAVARGGDATRYREIAIEARRSLVAMDRGDDSTFRALARDLAATGDQAAAAEAWLTLLSRAEPATPAWYRARLESLRLLAEIDREAATAAAEQFIVLHPEGGAPPYREPLLELTSDLLGREAGGG